MVLQPKSLLGKHFSKKLQKKKKKKGTHENHDETFSLSKIYCIKKQQNPHERFANLFSMMSFDHTCYVLAQSDWLMPPGASRELQTHDRGKQQDEQLH